MPILRNAKHEMFAQELAAGKPACDAYPNAGFKPNRHNAATLARKQHIVDRMNELLLERERIAAESTEKAIQSAGLTKEWIISKLIENAERALQAHPVRDADGEPTGEYRYEGNVANRALELLGKERGMFIDRKEIGLPGEFKSIEAMNADELRAFVAREAAAIGLRDEATTLGRGSGIPREQLN